MKDCNFIPAVPHSNSGRIVQQRANPEKNIFTFGLRNASFLRSYIIASEMSLNITEIDVSLLVSEWESL